MVLRNPPKKSCGCWFVSFHFTYTQTTTTLFQFQRKNKNYNSRPFGPISGWSFWRLHDWLVVSTTHLKHILVKMGKSSPILGVNIKTIWVATTQLEITISHINHPDQLTKQTLTCPPHRETVPHPYWRRAYGTRTIRHSPGVLHWNLSRGWFEGMKLPSDPREGA